MVNKHKLKKVYVKVVVPSSDMKGNEIKEEKVYQKSNFLLTKHYDDFFKTYVLALYKKVNGRWLWIGKTFDLDDEVYAKQWINAEVTLHKRLKNHNFRERK